MGQRKSGEGTEAPTLLVTGAGGGIGLATCVAAAEAGFEVFAGLRPGRRGEAARAELRQAAPSVEALELDVTDQDSVDAALGAVLDRHGRIDALVNSCGVTIHGAAEDFGDAEVEQMVAVNFTGPFRVIRAAAPSMRERASGRIVNVTSIGARTVSPYFNFYSATKHALAALSISLRYELERFGIAVTMVEPGAVRTGISAKAEVLAPSGSPHAERVQAVAERVRAGLEAGIDPAVPAARITEILNDPAPPFRVLVGEDAIRLAEATRELEGEQLFARMKGHWFAEESTPNTGAS
jgi:NAD(P)-dependent dehydrogenase (short-subunit alcohol dehydrogenase family)